MEHEKELMELRHEPVKGYPQIFKIMVIAAGIYLGGIFLISLF
jgi:hypothetical protein